MKVLNFKGGLATKVLALPGYNWTRLGIIERKESKVLERIVLGTNDGKNQLASIRVGVAATNRLSRQG
jgi:hypothetical protein